MESAEMKAAYYGSSDGTPRHRPHELETVSRQILYLVPRSTHHPTSSRARDFPRRGTGDEQLRRGRVTRELAHKARTSALDDAVDATINFLSSPLWCLIAEQDARSVTLLKPTWRLKCMHASDLRTGGARFVKWLEREKARRRPLDAFPPPPAFQASDWENNGGTRACMREARPLWASLFGGGMER